MISKRQRRIAAARAFENDPREFYEINMNECQHPHWMTRAFRNNVYTVMINDNSDTTHGRAIRAMVQKHNDMPFLNHWFEMQKIKNEIFGKEVTAVEYYPKESELENSHNIYWMWIFPEGVLPIPIR